MGSWNAVRDEQFGAAQHCKDGRYVRGCLSRAYYATYAAATEALQRAGIDVSIGGRPNPGHEQLIELVRHNLNRRKFSDEDRMKMARNMRRLLSFRIGADYDPESSFEIDDAVLALKMARSVQRMLDGVE
ncbi:MAG: hypothetical protein KF866_05720 [Phycisphaeraceae bacterium]|nr:hypothetical protein [Phycisphaeraceae bacterium]MCW5754492.1 hypothetical protein [Phycisphaeraceae bacterium]